MIPTLPLLVREPSPITLAGSHNPIKECRDPIQLEHYRNVQKKATSSSQNALHTLFCPKQVILSYVDQHTD